MRGEGVLEGQERRGRNVEMEGEERRRRRGYLPSKSVAQSAAVSHRNIVSWKLIKHTEGISNAAVSVYQQHPPR